MKLLLVLSIILFSVMITKTSEAGKIVDMEWAGGLLVVTYSPAKSFVECTAYNSNGDAIGGAMSISSGGVARVLVDVPWKYVGKKLRVSCKEK